jgi:anti-sigma factor RsiW
MNCHDVRAQWSLRRDSEGDPQWYVRIEDHLSACTECRQWFAEQNRLENLVVATLGGADPSAALWKRALARAGLSRRPHRRWLLRLAAAACITILLAGALGWLRWRDQSVPNRIARASVQWHGRLVSGEETLQFASDSDVQVEQYLRRRVSFPVRCPPRKDAGFDVEGAGVLRIGDWPAAYLYGSVRSEPVSLFVLPLTSGGGSIPSPGGTTHRRQAGHQVSMAAFDRNLVVVVGRAGELDLERLLRAYGSYPEQ